MLRTLARRRLRLRPILASAMLLGAAGACRSPVAAFGPDAASARTNADNLAAAIEHRFTNVQRSAKYSKARMQLGRYAFAPSKLVNDTSVWTDASTQRTGPARVLDVGATLSGNRFMFNERSGVPLPVRVGDERHRIRLAQVGEDDWRWSTDVDHAVGDTPPLRFDSVTRAIFLSFERPAATVRADYRAALPRTTRALGRMIVVDSLSTRSASDGSTLVSTHLRVQSRSLKSSGFPELAKYVDKYVEPAQFRFRLADRTGADWFDVNGDDGRIVFRFRSRGGELLPLTGAARRMPDTLELHVNARAKFGMFNVGVSKLQGEFVHVSNVRERSWDMRFAREPEWHLPLITERLLRSPLRRPFEQRGVQFRIGFRRGDQGQTLLSRTLDAVVRESAIMRFLGNLGFGAMSDYAGKVEEEENRFVAEAFAALREDIAATLVVR